MSSWNQNAVLPALAVPVLRTPDLARTLAHYRKALGFQPAQHVPGVVALLRHGPLRLQLWQCAGLPGPETCRVPLDGSLADVFDIHQRLACNARAFLDGAPRLKPWGAWEFSLTDGEGNRLMFVQWIVNSVVAQDNPAAGDDREQAKGREQPKGGAQLRGSEPSGEGRERPAP